MINTLDYPPFGILSSCMSFLDFGKDCFVDVTSPLLSTAPKNTFHLPQSRTTTSPDCGLDTVTNHNWTSVFTRMIYYMFWFTVTSKAKQLKGEIFCPDTKTLLNFKSGISVSSTRINKPSY